MPNTKLNPSTLINYLCFSSLIPSLPKNEPKSIVDIDANISRAVNVPSSLVTFTPTMPKLGVELRTSSATQLLCYEITGSEP